MIDNTNKFLNFHFKYILETHLILFYWPASNCSIDFGLKIPLLFDKRRADSDNLIRSNLAK